MDISAINSHDLAGPGSSQEPRTLSTFFIQWLGAQLCEPSSAAFLGQCGATESTVEFSYGLPSFQGVA